MIEDSVLSAFIDNRFGLDVTVDRSKTAEGQRYRLQPQGVPYTVGFVIDIMIGWRSLSATFAPGKFAAELVGAMENASAEQLALYHSFAHLAIANGAEMRVSINGEQVAPTDRSTWPERWQTLQMEFRKGSLLIDSTDARSTTQVVLPHVSRFIGAFLSLLPVIPATTDTDVPSYEEGSPTVVRSIRYERNRLNRAACIEFHGLTCSVCGMSFRAVYGEIGREFIEVHHINPLARAVESRPINPNTDLVPVCPNCHAMLHRRDPPLTVDELRGIVAAEEPR